MVETKAAPMRTLRPARSGGKRASSSDARIAEIDARLTKLSTEINLLEKVREALVATADRLGASADPLDLSEEAISRSAVLAEPSEMAEFLQGHLGQKLTAYVAGLKDVKTVGQWARGKVEPPALTRERLRAAFHATELLAVRYGDEAAQGWFFGANSSLDYRAPAAVLREAETPEELALIVPLARAFVRGAH